MKNTFFDFKLFVVPETTAISDRCQGKNQREILIILEAAVAEIDELGNFLGRMLGAARIDLAEDVSLLILQPGEQLPLSRVQSQVPFKTMLSFGIAPSRLGLHLEIPKYQSTLHAGITYLFADPLAAIYEERQSGGREMAGAMWAALQEIFLSAE